MDRRRVVGVGVLALAVIALAVGTGFGRPLVVGAASPSPVAPPPQVGDCLYAGPDGPWNPSRGDGSRDTSWEMVGYNRWYAPCGDPWFAEVVGVLDQADVARQAADGPDGIGVNPCTAVTANYLGRPEVPGVNGWSPVTASGAGLDPDRRQLRSGQSWVACVLAPLAWGPDGELVDGDVNVGARTTESLRGRWADLGFRDRWGWCENGVPLTEASVFCGDPHDREILAWFTFPEPTDAATLIEGCRTQAARLMQRDTVTGALSVEVALYGPDGEPEVVTAGTQVADHGGATCMVRATDPAAQLTATVVGLAGLLDPVTTG